MAAAGPPFDLILRGARPWGRGGLTDLGIRAGRIAAVGPDLPGPALQTIDLAGAALAPAFIEPHIHLDKAFSEARGHADGLARAATLAGTASDSPAQIRARTTRALNLLIAQGVTTARTHVNVGPTRRLTTLRAVLAAAEALGDRIDVQPVAFADVGFAPDHPDWPLMAEAVALGCTAVGGGTARRTDPAPFVAGLCRLAADTGCAVDLHTDEHLRPRCDGLEALLAETRRHALAGRVTASHCCALGTQPAPARAALIADMAAQGIAVVALPLTNLFLQGRETGQGTGPRGLAPVAELLAAGVRVTCGADNLQDPYLPYGNADPQLTLALTGIAGQLAGPGRDWLASAMTTEAAAVLGVPDVGLDPGCRADLIALQLPEGIAFGTAPAPLTLRLRAGRLSAA